MSVLTPKQLDAELARFPGWSVEDGQITKKFKAPSFHRAVGFVTQIAILAEKAGHHPDIDIRYDTVVIALSTHSEGGITEKDVALARKIDGAFE
ncbi:MAG: 4a-hydroxytetrahydrobiopterin dehydratase [Bacteroidetes bacterium]|nr:4a-hydroxytetrahydrobiopterin dehydratase [Bacteroidota bacterium]